LRKLIPATAVAALAAAALAVPADAARQAAQTAHFSVVAVETSSHRGPNNTLVFTERLRRHHRVIGHDRVVLRPAPRRGMFHAKAVFFLPEGKIKAQGNAGRGNNKLAVVGGTSGFNGVSGKLLLHDLGGNRTRIEFLLVR
jgi:hypothetical protein